MNLCKSYDLELLGDERGSLVVLDDISNIPFDIKRVYYIFNTQEGIARGFHAHKKLHQVAICLSGTCRMLMDDGKNKESILMDSPTMAIDIPPMLWHEMHDFSKDCILLILASDHYNESDYIRSYTNFKELIK